MPGKFRTDSVSTSPRLLKASRRETVGTGAGQIIFYQSLLWLDLLDVYQLKVEIPAQLKA